LILAPTKKEENFWWAVCEYSPDGDMIVTGGGHDYGLKFWDANTGELLKILQIGISIGCLAWTPDAKLIARCGSFASQFRKFDVTTWTEIHLEQNCNRDEPNGFTGIVLSPNERILASVSYNKTAQLWNFANNQPIEPPLYHDGPVRCVTFFADGKLLVTGCWLLEKWHLYTWDVSAIVKEAGLEDLLSDNVSLNASLL
jgi:WD40 repeat protein